MGMIRYRYLLVTVPPVAILTVALVLFDMSTSMTGEEFREQIRSLADLSQPVTLNLALAEMRARYIWLASVVLNIVVPIAVAVFCTWILYRRVSWCHLAMLTTVGVVLWLAALMVVLHNQATQGVLYRMAYGFTFLMLHSSDRFSATFLGHVQSILTLINGLAIVVPVLAVLAACSTLAEPADKHDANLDHYTDCMRRLRQVLYAGSAILVTGILHMYNWLRWPAALIGNDVVRDTAQGLALSVTVFWGATFTLILVATYAPAAIYLTRCARERLESEASKERPNIEQWLIERGFFVGLSDELPQISAIFAPLLAGPLGALLTASMTNSQ